MNKKLSLAEYAAYHDMNPYHEPAGSPEGGRFAERPGGGTDDPTHNEMAEHLRKVFGSEIDPFDVEEAIYWFASEWHGGQSSNLYSALSTSEYRPGPITRGPEAGGMGEMAKQELEATFTFTPYTPRKTKDMNPYHEPAGSEAGGEFAEAPGGTAKPTDYQRRHYEHIAAMLKEVGDPDLAQHFANEMQGTNPNFNRSFFLTASTGPGYNNKSYGRKVDFSSRHFAHIARTLKSGSASAETVEHFARGLASTNPNFKYDKFKKAAGFYL